jgi:hypothetical protein
LRGSLRTKIYSRIDGMALYARGSVEWNQPRTIDVTNGPDPATWNLYVFYLHN